MHTRCCHSAREGQESRHITRQHFCVEPLVYSQEPQTYERDIFARRVKEHMPDTERGIEGLRCLVKTTQLDVELTLMLSNSGHDGSAHKTVAHPYLLSHSVQLLCWWMTGCHASARLLLPCSTTKLLRVETWPSRLLTLSSTWQSACQRSGVTTWRT